MLVLNNISSGYSTGAINANFRAIEDYINNNTLKRDGLENGEANQMENALDMNGQSILNVAGVGNLVTYILQLQARIVQLENRVV